MRFFPRGIGPRLNVSLIIFALVLGAPMAAVVLIDPGAETTALALAIFALVLVIALAVAAYLNRRFLLRPITQLVDATRSVAAGNLETEIPVTSDDELGTLAGAFNEMTAMLRRRDATLQAEIEERERTEAELNALFAAMTDIVCVVDRDGRYLRVPPTAGPTPGLPRERIVGTTVFDHFEPNTAAALLDTIRRALATRRPATVEYRMPGDSESWAFGSASAMTEDTVVWVTRDITEMVLSRQLLEQRVAEQTRQLSNLVEISQGVTTSGAFQPLVDRILSQLLEALPSRGVSLVILRNGQLELLEMRRGGVPALYYGLDDVIWPKLAARECVFIPDAWGDDEIAVAFRASQGENLPALSRKISSFLGVPLALGDQVYGAIMLSRIERSAFSTRDAEVAMAFASQAALAFRNAELISQAERRARENEGLSRIAASLSLDRPTDSTMHAVAEAVLSATTALAAGVIVLDPEQDRLHMMGGAGLPPGYIEAVERAWAEGALSTSFEAALTGAPSVARGARQMMLDDPAYGPLHPFLVEAPWETVIVLPLRYHGKPVGALNVCYAEGADPGSEECQFLNVIADQAAVAVQNIRLYRETEARARHNEVLSRVSSALAFAEQPERAFATLAERIVEGTNAMACAVVLRRSDGSPRMVGTAGMPQEYAADMEVAWRRGVRGMTSEVLSTGELRMFRNSRDRIFGEPRYGRVQQHWRNSGWDTSVILPLSYGGATVGAIGCYYGRDLQPGPDELKLLEAIAGQAAVAVENARLFTHSERRVRELEAVASISSNFTFQQSLDAMMAEMARTIVGVSPAAQACTITLADPDTLRSTRLLGVYGMPEGFSEALVAAWRAGAPSATLNTLSEGTTRIVHDARRRTLGQPGYEKAYDMIRDATWDTLAMFPMVYREKPVGLVIVSYAGDTEPDPEEIAFLEAIADQAAVAVENARLFSQAQSVAVIEERQRLSRELHDSVSQALYGISLGAQTAIELLERDPSRVAEPLDYVLSLSEAGIAEMRALIFELRPEALETEGLLGALRKQAASMRARHAMDVETDFCDEPNLPLDSKETLFRIAQEALHNVVKHADASTVHLRLAEENSEVVLEVQDDGKGFAVQEDYPGHLGLRSMRERTLHLGGYVTVDSTPGNGTRVTTRLPLPRGAQTQ